MREVLDYSIYFILILKRREWLFFLLQTVWNWVLLRIIIPLFSLFVFRHVLYCYRATCAAFCTIFLCCFFCITFTSVLGYGVVSLRRQARISHNWCGNSRSQWRWHMNVTKTTVTFTVIPTQTGRVPTCIYEDYVWPLLCVEWSVTRSILMLSQHVCGQRGSHSCVAITTTVTPPHTQPSPLIIIRVVTWDPTLHCNNNLKDKDKTMQAKQILKPLAGSYYTENYR